LASFGLKKIKFQRYAIPAKPQGSISISSIEEDEDMRRRIKRTKLTKSHAI
jgi:hypothetical protein